MNPAKKTYIDPKDLPRVERATLRRILATLAPYRSRVALVVLAILASSLLNLLPPFFVKRAVDQAIPAGDLRLLLLLCAGMVVGPVLAGLVGVFQKHLTTSTSETLMRDLRVRMFEHFQGLPYSYFVHARPGEAIAAVISDVQGVGSVVATTLVDVLDGIVVFTTTAAVLVYFDWRLALVTLALLPLFVVPTRSVGRERKRMRRAAQARAAELVGILDEALSASGILLARVFGAERFEAARLREKAGEIAELSLRQAMVGRWFRLLIGLFEAVGPGARLRVRRPAGDAARPRARDARRVRHPAAAALRRGLLAHHRPRGPGELLRLLRARVPGARHGSRRRRRAAACDPRCAGRSSSGTSRSPTRTASSRCRTSTSRWSPGSAWRSWAPRARARARSSRCCCACTTRRAARSGSTGTTCASLDRGGCARTSAS